MERFTNRQISRLTGLAPSNVSLYLSRLQELHYVRKISQEGRKKYFQIAYDALFIRENFKGPSSPPLLPQKKNSAQKIRKKKVLEYLTKQKKITLGEYQRLFDISSSTATRNLKAFVGEKDILKRGRGKKAHYVLG